MIILDVTLNNVIPSVRTKVVFPKKRDIGVSYSRMLLHDTMLKDGSYRTGTSDTPVCECGKGNETVILRHVSYC